MSAPGERAEDLGVAPPAGGPARVRVLDLGALGGPEGGARWTEEELTVGTWSALAPDPPRTSSSSP